MKPLRTSKARTAAEQAEDRLVFDRPITLQQYSVQTHEWTDTEHIHANVNKAVSAGGQAPADSSHTRRYLLKVRFFGALDDVRANLQKYRVLYSGQTYELADYETMSLDAIGQQISTDTLTALPCTEYEVTEDERSDAYQIGLRLAYRLRIFRDEYDGQRRAEYGGQRYRIGSVRYVGDCADLYLGERIGDLSGS